MICNIKSIASDNVRWHRQKADTNTFALMRRRNVQTAPLKWNRRIFAHSLAYTHEHTPFQSAENANYFLDSSCVRMHSRRNFADIVWKCWMRCLQQYIIADYFLSLDIINSFLILARLESHNFNTDALYTVVHSAISHPYAEWKMLNQNHLSHTHSEISN